MAKCSRNRCAGKVQGHFTCSKNWVAKNTLWKTLPVGCWRGKLQSFYKWPVFFSKFNSDILLKDWRKSFCIILHIVSKPRFFSNPLWQCFSTRFLGNVCTYANPVNLGCPLLGIRCFRPLDLGLIAQGTTGDCETWVCI